jgi:SynChlorMet cassette radical SAM/SPASM protein ScmF
MDKFTIDGAAPGKLTRSLNAIYFYLTDGCNLRCRHCWIQPEYEPSGLSCKHLSPELFRSIIAQAKPLGLSSVKLTGGEPLLHPGIREILGHVRSEGLRLVVETNGVLCTPEIAREIAACKNPFVSVSIDGADAATHEWMRGVDGCFDDAIAGLRNLVDAGLKPQVIMTLNRKNYRQMEALVRLAERCGARSVKFNTLQPTARGKQMWEAGDNLAMEDLVALGAWVERELVKQTSLRLDYGHPMAFKGLKNMFRHGGCGCSVCGIMGIIGVLADGSYAICGMGENAPELVFGHASADRLADVWANTPILNELREGLPERLGGVCGDCIHKIVCKGNCIAHNYNMNKSLWAPFWYCEEARRKGLFPISRLLRTRGEFTVPVQVQPSGI